MLHGEDRSADSSDRAPAFGFQNIVGESPLLREAISLATRVAGTRRTTVLLIGETGTGKELFARGIHYAERRGRRAVRRDQLRGDSRDAARVGAVRARARRVHRRARAQARPARARRRRGRCSSTKCTTCRAMLQPKLLRALESRRVRRLGGSRRVRDRMPDHRGGEPAPRAGRRQRRVPRGSLLSPERLLDHAAAAPRPARGRRASSRATFSRDETREHQTAEARSRTTRSPRCSCIAGPGNVRELKNVVERAAILSGDSPVVRAEHLMIQRRTARSRARRRRGRRDPHSARRASCSRTSSARRSRSRSRSRTAIRRRRRVCSASRARRWRRR